MASGDAEVRLEVVGVNALRPHEETIPEHIESVKAQILRDGVQKDPIIVDDQSMTVLDGMHRLAAFRSLGSKNAVCSLVRYAKPNVELLRWGRVYSGGSKPQIESVLAELRLDKFASPREVAEYLRKSEGGLGAFLGGDARLPSADLDLEQAFSVVRRIDSKAEAMGWGRRFVADQELEARLGAMDGLVVLVQTLRKDNVVKAGKTGKLFPCKTSMHSIDPRPVGVNFPVDELDSATTSGLLNLVGERSTHLLPRGSTYEGRKYKERLLVFDPS